MSAITASRLVFILAYYQLMLESLSETVPGPMNKLPVHQAPKHMGEPSLKTRLAFHAWRTLLLISLGTFAAGLLGHILTILAAPWLKLSTQAAIHASIPVLLTAVKFVTVPLLLLLTPFAHRHPTFQSWEQWGKDHMKNIEHAASIPWNMVKSVFRRAKSIF
jgi:hypothetical protein